MRIYVAGPYTADDARKVQMNVDIAIEDGCKLMRKGWTPFIPHLSHYIWMHPDGDFDYKTWTAMDFEWLQFCDALYVIAPSPGALAEVDYAKKHNIPVYDDIDDIPNSDSFIKVHEMPSRAELMQRRFTI